MKLIVCLGNRTLKIIAINLIYLKWDIQASHININKNASATNTKYIDDI